MEFKDLPKEIQIIAATTLGDSLVKIDPAYTKKETIDNMVRNVPMLQRSMVRMPPMVPF